MQEIPGLNTSFLPVEQSNQTYFHKLYIIIVCQENMYYIWSK